MARSIVGVRRLVPLAVLLIVVLACALPAATAGATGGTSTVSGSMWQDLDRDGVHDPGEAGFSGITIELYNASGAWVTGAGTDAGGNYSVGALADGTYDVRVRVSDWWNLRHDWVPTTTGTLFYRRTVTVAGTATADFGLRPIVRSRTLGAPISSVRAANGTLVESYDDAVTAQTVLDHLQGGSLLGPEGPSVAVRFDFQEGGTCSSMVFGSPGAYTGYSAAVWADYLTWINDGDRGLFHEYGHGWSHYHDYMVQQDGAFSGYLQVRGVAGDPRLGTSHSWDPAEMIAEDYRLLFGTASSRAYPQENTDIAPAAQVPGLATYLRDVFTQPAGGGTPPPTDPPPPATAPLAVTGVVMSPDPVVTNGTASFSLSGAANVTVTIVDSQGAVTRKLVTAVPLPAGTSTRPWDRTTDAGRKAKAGTYTLVVRATDGTGQTADASFRFNVVDPSKSGGGKPSR